MQKLSPLPPSLATTVEGSRWMTNAQQLLNTALESTNGYYAIAPVTGSTVVVPAKISSVLMQPLGALAVLTVQLPLGVPDGMVLRIASSQAITALTITGTGTVVILNAPTTLAAGAGVAFQFMAAAAATGIATPTWQRLY